MIVIELLAGILIAVVVITGIMKVAAPIADAFSERLRLKFQELGPEQERQYRLRLESLEEQVRQLQSQVTNLQEVANFNTGITTTSNAGEVKEIISSEAAQQRHH
ncbi:MAG: hypothetical protein EKK48_00040 [Candidatus Melainabacteria bacterium]|nr:MAG: hypothetical protein EKK48_00040 [Candidatus Melainabacteria bacterium]